MPYNMVIVSPNEKKKKNVLPNEKKKKNVLPNEKKKKDHLTDRKSVGIKQQQKINSKPINFLTLGEKN